MTAPDLTALRALVEADPARYVAAMFAKLNGVDKEAFNFCIRQARNSAAREELERIGKGEGCEVCGHRKGGLQTGPRNPWQINLDRAETSLAALEGATEQLTRDAMYWRKRAEDAEARAVQQGEMRKPR